jgi:hypothetical protein
MKEADYVLRIRALADRVPVEQRLRGVLKRLLRTYGFECCSVAPVQDFEADFPSTFESTPALKPKAEG